jgi:hypothetical protein
MIRPLRRRHRWMIPTVFLLLFIATILAVAYPAPSARVDTVPPAVGSAEGSRASR